MQAFYAVVILLIASQTAFSQKITLRGRVKSGADGALTGVYVSVKGSATGTSTNEGGEFSVAAQKLPATLIFSYVGYATKELVVDKKDSSKYISIVLAPIDLALNEVVVVGYASDKRRDVRSSFTKTTESRVAGLGIGRVEKTGNVHSKTLTAGELSDFKKWKLWEGYTKAEFKQWSEHWDIAPVNRYSVQVQNEDRKGIAGENVYLIDLESSDTVWRTVTDNTGKAELWANFNASDGNKKTYTIACGGQTNRFPDVFENGINHFTLKKSCAHSNVADIAFVVDATGSMGDEIKYLQEELQDVITHTSANNKGIELHIGAVFYRDRVDEYLTRSIDFQTGYSSLAQFIKKQSANGGGDFPEAVEEGLTSALDSLHWDAGARSKILFLILDAPPHDEAKYKMKKLILQSAAMGIRIVPVVCSGIDKSTEYLMRSIALATNGSYVFLTDDSGVGDTHIKPTTDNFKVELLNDLLQRLILEMVFMASCDDKERSEEPVNPDKNVAKVVVYPNPSSGQIRITSSEKIKELFITDFTGKVLERIGASSKKQSWQVDLSRYPSGTYLIQYFTEQQTRGAEKVLLIRS